MPRASYRFFSASYETGGAGPRSSQPVPGLTYLSSVLSDAAGVLVVETPFGPQQARSSYNAPVRAGMQALVVQRNGVWLVLGVYP